MPDASVPNASLARATISNLDKPNETTTCMFNPKEYTVTKQNSWTVGKTAGNSVPPLEFGSGNPATLQMQLFFDTYRDAGDAGRPADVSKKYTSFIWNLMLVDPKLNEGKKHGRPPHVRFQWGETWTFDAVITSITQKFTLFAPNGTPVRATLDVTFQQLKPEIPVSQHQPRQNPTSGGVGGERIWTVREGETLASIAYQQYGDPGLWRRIADANRLINVRRLSPGAILLLPNE